MKFVNDLLFAYNFALCRIDLLRIDFVPILKVSSRNPSITDVIIIVRCLSPRLILSLWKCLFLKSVNMMILVTHTVTHPPSFQERGGLIYLSSSARDVTSHNIKRGSPIFACSLDGDAAFDATARSVLFDRTLNVMSDPCWKILYN